MVAPVAQLDRASASGVEGHEFESRRVYHFLKIISAKVFSFCGFFVKALFPIWEDDAGKAGKLLFARKEAERRLRYSFPLVPP